MEQMLTIASTSAYTLTVTYHDGTLTYTVNEKSVSKQICGELGLILCMKVSYAILEIIYKIFPKEIF